MDNIESSKIPYHSQNPGNSHTSMPLETSNLHENGEKRSVKHPKRENNNEKRYLGVRQRPSGRWVAEIKESTQKLRLWLGTFDRAEEAATAYDSAARLLRGRNAKTNFTYHKTMTTHQENCSLLGKNPRLYQLLKHALMKNLANSSSPNFTKIPWRNQNGGSTDQTDSVDHFDAIVEETIVCSSSAEDGFKSYGSEEREKVLRLSLGSSKVYSSVIVAPSFGASVSTQGGEEENNCEEAQSLDSLLFHANRLAEN